jgi:ATP-dependent helicase/nuclease subunit A
VTVPFRPVDEAERRAIARQVTVNMCVEAGAGTGKTTVLVDRIVHIITSGHATIDQVAVITFTEKAAAELSGRVRKALEDARAESGEIPRGRIDAALLALNHAHIETIHAFAASMLRERPVEAGLDPGFDVLDTLPSQLDFEAAYSEWINGQMANDPPPEALLEALDLGLEPQRIRECAEALHRHRQLLPLAPYTTPTVDIDATLTALQDDARVMRSLEHRVIDDADHGYVQIQRLAREIESFESLRGTPSSLRRAILEFPNVNPNAGNKQRWQSGSDLAEIKQAFGRVKRTIEETRATVRAKATADVVHWLQGFVGAYAARRKQAGKADFDDLLLWARDLVRGSEEVRRYYADRYRCILVDEFQDTDPLQVEMVAHLCAEEISGGDWRTARLRPGSLFVVGDPKQSIYRFRSADITMYDTVKESLFDGAPRRIVQNFRSVQPIIDWANRVFGSMMQAAPGVQPEYIPLTAHPDLVAPPDAVTVLRGNAPRLNSAGAARAVRQYEGERIAAIVAANLADGTWSVRDGDDSRPATYRDVVVLIPTRTDLDVYEDAFALAGIPYRHEGGRTFFLRQEIIELINVLCAIDDPSDGVAAIGALRSPAFGCSDEDLVFHKAQRASFDHRALSQMASGYAADCLRVLGDLSHERHRVTLPELIRRTLDRTRLVEFAMLQPQGDQVAANLLKVIDQARAFSEASGRGLRSFVRWLRINTERTTDETDAPISEETDDVVRIITIHAAKGLEFPIVVFANMNGSRANMTKVIADRVNRQLHVKLGARDRGFMTPGYDVAEATEQQHGFAEEQRLLYVAATRAKDRLVLPFVKDDVTDCFNGWLLAAGALSIDATDADALPAFAGELPVWRDAFAANDDGRDSDVIVAEREGWLDERERLIAAASTPLLVQTATALKPEWARPALGADDVRRGRAADFGSAVHALLERTPLDALRASPEIARSVAAEHGQQGREDEMVRLAGAALASEVMARARRSPRVLREAPFVAGLPGLPGVAEGRIDLLFLEDGEIVIVDFKTDRLTPADVQARAAHYGNQALIYAWACAEATGAPVREVVFLFAVPAVEHRVPVTAKMLAEARAILSSPVLA